MLEQNEVNTKGRYAMLQSSDQDFFSETFVPFSFTFFVVGKNCDSLWSQLFQVFGENNLCIGRR